MRKACISHQNIANKRKSPTESAEDAVPILGPAPTGVPSPVEGPLRTRGLGLATDDVPSRVEGALRERREKLFDTD